MQLFERPGYYAVSHVAFGFIGVWYPIVLALAILYQIVQYVFQVRVFPVEGTIRSGNSLAHTGLKLAEMAFGYILGRVVRRMKLRIQ